MHSPRIELRYAVFAILIAIVSVFAATIVLSPSRSAPTTENAVVVGTKSRYLSSQSNYLFKSGTSLVIEAPQIAEWIFDHIEVDFGCEVGGVTGSNVSSIFTINNGFIQTCRAG